MLRRWPHWLLLLTLFGALALAFTNGDRSAGFKAPGVALLTPVLSIAKDITDSFGNIISLITTVGQLEDENKQLIEQVVRLERDIIQLKEAGEENRSLRGLLGYQRDNPGHQYLSASVIANDPSRMVQAVVIDRGTEQGVQKGMVVVGDHGMVGIVQEAYPKVAKVLLTADPSSTVNGVVQRSRVQGVVSGKADGSLQMQFVSKEADIKQGDIVVTSGLGGGFPKGLLLGAVTKVSSNDQELFKEVMLEPTARVDTLDHVLVILDFLPLPLP